MLVDNITELIGDTPLLKIDPAVTGLKNVDLYAKLEMMNPISASVKDRAAWAMLRDDISSVAAQGDMVVELSSGNTAKALAVMASIHDVPFKTVTNRMKIPELRQLLLLLGAQLEELPGTAECVDPSDPEDPLAKAHHMLTSDGAGFFHTDQYFNHRNIDTHFQTTGPEIINDLGFAPDHLVVGVGTAGSSMGTAEALRKENDALVVTGVIPSKGDFLPGLRDSDELQEVGLFKAENYDRFETVSSDDAINGMMTLIRRCGVLAGPTAGAAYAAAITSLQPVDASATKRLSAVFIVCDRVESYVQWISRRRPELVNEPVQQNSVSRLSNEELRDAPTLDVEQAAPWIARHCPTIVDMRGWSAFRALHIEGSMNIFDGVFAEMCLGGLPFEPDAPLLLVCPVGDQSRKYAALLTKMGHRNVYSLEGGVIAWRDAGQPLVRLRTTSTEKLSHA